MNCIASNLPVLLRPFPTALISLDLELGDELDVTGRAGRVPPPPQRSCTPDDIRWKEVGRFGLEELGLHRREAPERERGPGGLACQPGEQTVLVFEGKVGLEHPARCCAESDDVLEFERGIGNERVEDGRDEFADGRDVLRWRLWSLLGRLHLRWCSFQEWRAPGVMHPGFRFDG